MSIKFWNPPPPPKFVWMWGEHRGALSVWTACEVCLTSPCQSHFNCDLCLLQFSQGCWSHARRDRGVCRHGHWLPSFMCDFCKTGCPKLSSSGSSGSVWFVYTRILREQAAYNTTSYSPTIRLERGCLCFLVRRMTRYSHRVSFVMA